MINESWLEKPVRISLTDISGNNVTSVEGVITSLGKRELILDRTSVHPIITHAQTFIPYSVMGGYYLGASSNK